MAQLPDPSEIAWTYAEVSERSARLIHKVFRDQFNKGATQHAGKFRLESKCS